MRASGASWSQVCDETGLSKGTAQRALQNLPKNPKLPKNSIPREPVIGFVWAAQN